jgi:O-antigen ligase
LLLGTPVVLAMAMLRPEWMILVLVAIPPSAVFPIPPMQMAAIMLATLFGFLLQGRLHLGPQTGIYPLVGIILLAVVRTAEPSIGVALAADATLKTLIYYTLLMLVAFCSAEHGGIGIDTFISALLIGIVAALILQPFIYPHAFQSIAETPFRGQIAYLAAMGFGVSYVRSSLRRSEGRSQSFLGTLLVAILFCLTAIGFGRAAWMAALAVFALVSIWTRRKSIWVISSLLVVLALTVPVIQERLIPGSSEDAADVTLAGVTSGRWVLWVDLFERGADALPFGQGWGYMGSLTSADIVGFPAPDTPGSGYLFAHNDFLLLFVELGVVGFGLLTLFWLDLARKIRSLSLRGDSKTRYDARVLVPIVIVMFVVQLFDNGFAIRFVAERFFIAAGLLYGLHYRQAWARSDLGSPVASAATTSVWNSAV